jgi:predicted dehydrogenase
MLRIGSGEQIRVGVFGAKRGLSITRSAGAAAGLELVAVCDSWEEGARRVQAECGGEDQVTIHGDFDEFLSQDFDAVILANYFHQHTPFAVKALEAGKHVMSECAACHTLAEGVALARAVDESGRIYMFAENYPYFAANQEMRRLYQDGFVGKFTYGEGEYIHPSTVEQRLSISPGLQHWRNWIPSTYYCTHSLAPVMYITDTRPVTVNGFVIPRDHDHPEHALTVNRQDPASIIMCRMDNQALVKLAQVSMRGHGNHYRIHGDRGLMETVRGSNELRVHKEAFDNGGERVDRRYVPEFPVHSEVASKATHGGGDFFTNYYFGKAIREGRQPYLDVYKGIDMSIVGILAYQSALAGGIPLDVPDFRDETQRQDYENDHWSPDPERAGPGQPLPSVTGDIQPSPEATELAKSVWSSIGHDVDTP